MVGRDGVGENIIQSLPILHSIETMPHLIDARRALAGRIQRCSCIQAELHTARPPYHRDTKEERRMATCGYHMVKTSTRDERKVSGESEAPSSIAEKRTRRRNLPLPAKDLTSATSKGYIFQGCGTTLHKTYQKIVHAQPANCSTTDLLVHCS